MTVSTVTFPRRSRRGIMLGFSLTRVVALIGGIVALSFGLFSGTSAGLAFGVTMLTFGVLGAMVKIRGRYLAEWLIPVAHWQLRGVQNQRDYRALIEKPRPAGNLALPGTAARLRKLVASDGTVYIHDNRGAFGSAGTLTAALTVTHSAMVLLDPDKQAERVAGWARALSGLAGTGTVDHVAIIEETIPETGSGPLDFFMEEWTRKEDWPSREYYELLTTLSARGATHRTTATLTVTIGRKGLKDAVTNLESQRTTFERSLRDAGLRPGKWLDESTMAKQIRQSYAPYSLPSVEELDLAGPVAIAEKWGSLRHDDGYSTVLAISEFPTSPVDPQFLHSLVFAPGVRHTLTLHARVKDLDTALKAVRRDKVAVFTEAQQKAKVGQLSARSDQDEFSAIEAREAALLRGHNAVVLTGLITVTAPSEEELENAVTQIKREANQCACEARVLYGMQAAAFVATSLPVGRGI